MSWNNITPAWTAEEELKCKVNNQPLSSIVLAHTVDRLMGIPYTQMDIPSAMSVKVTNPVIHYINTQLELQRFFNQS
jgi:hypothetical protein